MIVDMRDGPIQPSLDQYRRDITNGQLAQADLALGVANYQQRERAFETRRVQREIESDRARRTALQRNTMRAVREGAKFGMGFDAESLGKMSNELLADPDYSSTFSRLVDTYNEIQFPDDQSALQSPEVAAFYGDVAELYGIREAQRAGEAKAAGVERLAGLAADERAGLGQSDVDDLLELAGDESVGMQEFQSTVDDLIDKAEANIGFHEAKIVVTAETEELFKKVSAQFAAPSGEMAGLGLAEESPGAELMKLRGAIEAAADPEELIRARGNFMLKAMNLDGFIDEAEQAAFDAGLRAARESLGSGEGITQGILGGGQVQRAQPVAQETADPREAALAPHMQRARRDARQAGIDPDAEPERFSQFVEAQERAGSLEYKSEDQLAELRREKEEAEGAREQQQRRRAGSNFTVGSFLRGPIGALTNNEDISVEEAEAFIRENGLAQWGIGVLEDFEDMMGAVGGAVAGAAGAVKGAAGTAGRLYNYSFQDQNTDIDAPSGRARRAIDAGRGGPRRRTAKRQQGETLSHEWAMKEVQESDRFKGEAELEEYLGQMSKVMGFEVDELLDAMPEEVRTDLAKLGKVRTYIALEDAWRKLSEAKK